MSYEAEQVRKFYDVIWNRQDTSVIPDVLDEALVFRGSLGEEKTGHEGFIEYLDRVHRALGGYECVIEEMVTEDTRVFARMKFSGIHQGKILGYEPTGRAISWEGAALFHFREGRVISLWVLGDLKTLEGQLANNSR